MRRIRLSSVILAATSGLGLGGCQTGAALQPAALVEADAEVISKLKTALADAVGRARIELGAGDLKGASVITVLPPPPGPYETRSMALPVEFDLLADERGCYARQRGRLDLIALNGVACRILD